MVTPHNRIALVTGAGSGIGKASRHPPARDGWRVVFTGRRLEALREAIAAAGDPFGDIDQRALAVPADVTQARRGGRAVRRRARALRPARPAVQQRRHRRPAGAAGRPDASSTGAAWSTPT